MGYLEESGSKELTPATYPGERFHQQLLLSGALNYGAKEDLPLRHYLLVLFRYRYVVLGCALLGMAFSVLVNYFSIPNYNSTAVVTIGSYVPPLDGPMAAMLRDDTRKSEYVKNQIALLESNTIANLVLSDNPDILEFLGYGDYVTAPTLSKRKSASADIDAVAGEEDTRMSDIPVNALEAYLQHISYTKVYETTMVKITAVATNAEMAAKIANAHANAFIVLVRQHRLRAANVNLKFLEKSAQKSAEKTSLAEHQLVEYALKHNITAGQGIGESNQQANLDSLKRNLAEATLEQASRDAEMREVRNRSGGFGSISDYNPALHQQYLDLAEIEGEIEQIKKINRNHPALKILKKQSDTLRQTLRGYTERQVKDSETALKVATQKKHILEREVEDAQRKNLEQSQSAVEYNLLERQHKAAKEQHLAFTQRLEDAIVNAENDQKTVILVDPALPPTAPSNLGDTITLWHGLFLGLLAGFGMTVLLNILDNKIRTVGDIQSTLNVPVLGVVPAFSRGRLGISIAGPAGKETGIVKGPDDTMVTNRSLTPVNGTGTFMAGDSETGLYPVHGGYGETQHMPAPAGTGIMSRHQESVVNKSIVQSLYTESSGDGETEILDRSIVLVSAPFSTESEAFRTVLTTLTYSSEAEVPKVIFITSGQQGEGKSTVATNLAVALGEMSGNTLLIDADLRLPTIHKHFNRPRLTPGLADYLCGQRDYNEVLCRGYVNNLSVLFAGNPVVTPGMLLQSKKMSELLELLSDEFEHIIIDGPPLAHVADSLLLSRLADGVVLVVRSGKTSKPVAQSAMQHLQQVRANVIGTVLNGVARSRSSKQSDYYYVVDNYPKA